jgi:hypothetical protein
MRIGLIFLILSALLFAFSSGCTAPSDPGAEEAAVNISLEWLQQVDEGNYSGTWNEAAQFFKTAVDKNQWQAKIKAVREPLGRVISREITSKKYAEELPGAPDGQYFVIQFKTSFENKKSSVETVTPMLDKDGMWRVAGYYIK